MANTIGNISPVYKNTLLSQQKVISLVLLAIGMILLIDFPSKHWDYPSFLLLATLSIIILSDIFIIYLI